MKKFFGHLHTINKHRFIVFKHCCKAGIFFRGLVHDLSKYSPVEFNVSVKYFQGNRSPNEKERELKGYSSAWLHHKGRNLHHFEYWYDYNKEVHAYAPIKMPLKYLKEMFCDRVAASKVYKGKKYKDSDPLEYLVVHHTARLMHKDTANELVKWLTMLSEVGEKETFKYIRKKKYY